MRNLLLLQMLQLGDVGVYGVLDGGCGTIGDVPLSVLGNGGGRLRAVDSRRLVNDGLWNASHQCWALVDYSGWGVVDHGSGSTVVVADTAETVAVAVADKLPKLGKGWGVVNEGGSRDASVDGPQVVSSWSLVDDSGGSDGSAVAVGQTVGATGLNGVGRALADEGGTSEASIEATLKSSAVVAKTSDTIGEGASRVDGDGGWTLLNVLAGESEGTGNLMNKGGTGAGDSGCAVASDAVAWGLLNDGARCGHRGGPVARHGDAWSLVDQGGWSRHGGGPVAGDADDAWGLLDVGGRGGNGSGPVASHSDTWSMLDDSGAWSGYGSSPVAGDGNARSLVKVCALTQDSVSSVSAVGNETRGVERSVAGTANAVSVAVAHWPGVIGDLRNSDGAVAVSKSIGVAGLVLHESCTRSRDGTGLSVVETVAKTVAIHCSGPDGGEGATRLVGKAAVSVRRSRDGGGGDLSWAVGHGSVANAVRRSWDGGGGDLAWSVGHGSIAKAIRGSGTNAHAGSSVDECGAGETIAGSSDAVAVGSTGPHEGEGASEAKAVSSTVGAVGAWSVSDDRPWSVTDNGSVANNRSRGLAYGKSWCVTNKADSLGDSVAWCGGSVHGAGLVADEGALCEHSSRSVGNGVGGTLGHGVGGWLLNHPD